LALSLLLAVALALALALARLALAWQWLLPGTREKYLSRESLPRVSRVCCHASRLLADAPPAFWLQSPLNPLHPTRDAHTIA
jgi:hypothetical protein